MGRPTADLREIVDAVKIQAADRFSVSGYTFDVPTDEDSVIPMRSLLASTLYQRLYCRPSRGFVSFAGETRATRVFVDDLSRANCGTGTWEPRWVVRAVEDDGTLMVHNKSNDLTLWAQPQQFRPLGDSIRVGGVGRLRVGKELRGMLPGYYTVLGDADQPFDDVGAGVAIVRFYWHLTAEGSSVWIRELTQRFNGANVPFRAKVQSDPNAYLRADAGVLYVARTDVPEVLVLLSSLHLTVSPHLRSATPMFTKRLARGLAVAEDPGDGRSFGQHRCELVADGLVDAFERGRTAIPDLTEAVAARFAHEGLVITRPWLNAGSRQVYVWPTRRSRAARLSGT